MQRKRETLVVVRGGGDIATGTIQKLWNSGFGLVILETDRPTAIRRKVALSQAVYESKARMRSKKNGKKDGFRFWWIRNAAALRI